MELIPYMEKHGHEQVVFCVNEDAGLRAIIAIHDTTLGPALGGTRMWPYQSEEEALRDALRLARGMAYKAAAAGLNLGGGKAVIVGDPKKDKSEALFRAYGRFVDTLGGRYITAEDVGTDVNDMEYIRMETRHVVGISKTMQGSGDPSPVTAHGVIQGLRACAEERLHRDNLNGVSIAIQGLGKVGYYLCKFLSEEGVRIFGCDLDAENSERARQEFGVEVVAPEAIIDVQVDIFCPAALGGIVNDETMDRFRCQVIAGPANNQLAEDRHGDELARRGILYAPDYVINAGGLINVYVELEGYNRERAMVMTRGIYYNLKRVFAIARGQAIGTHIAADRMAEERIAAVRNVHKTYVPGMDRYPGRTRMPTR
ncbi:MAG: Glu/Leu/Phe/Val dehydrogenase [Candidatus Schekmanbacteria bacterium]|nr:Glu/Leu/Phe/Val dehydrogenase [Candidatus Schekmanbacteria bacterium]